jgi:hypothetical protein
MFRPELFQEEVCKYVASKMANSLRSYINRVKALKKPGDGIFELDEKWKERWGDTFDDIRTDIDHMEEEITDAFSGSPYFTDGIYEYLDQSDSAEKQEIINLFGATDEMYEFAESNSPDDVETGVAYYILDDYVIENLDSFVADIRDMLLGLYS